MSYTALRSIHSFVLLRGLAKIIVCINYNVLWLNYSSKNYRVCINYVESLSEPDFPGRMLCL